MTMEEIIKDPKFSEFLEEKIKEYGNKPPCEPGYHYRRTPFDALREEGLLDASGIKKAFITIVARKCGLPKSQRDAVTLLVMEAANRTVAYRAKHPSEEKKPAKRTGKASAPKEKFVTAKHTDPPARKGKPASK